MKTTVRHCIVKESARIKELLEIRFKEASVKRKDIVADAKAHNMQFTEASLSRYLNDKNSTNGLSQENIMWLCKRYQIPVLLLVGKPELKQKDGKAGLEIVLPQFNLKKFKDE